MKKHTHSFGSYKMRALKFGETSNHEWFTNLEELLDGLDCNCTFKMCLASRLHDLDPPLHYVKARSYIEIELRDWKAIVRPGQWIVRWSKIDLHVYNDSVFTEFYDEIK